MAWLKVYEWESQTWPGFERISLDRPAQQKYLNKLCRHFKVPVPSFKWSYRRGVALGAGGGSYHGHGGVYAFIRIGKVSTMATLVHEFAHHLNAAHYGGDHHDRTFKRALKRSYTWAKRWLPPSSVLAG